MKTISKCMKASNGNWNGHHGFTNSKLGLISMTVFCDEMTGLVDNRRAADIIDHGFSKIFGTFFYGILIAKLRRLVPDR